MTRPLTLTKICKVCGHQYGLWRERCTACGEINKHREDAVAAPRRARPERASTVVRCVFCQERKPTAACARCQAPLHPSCRRLHELTCQA